jgi:hypothetical protein
MSVTYQFCISRKSESKFEKFGAEYHFGDVDPGREVARVLVSSKYSQSNSTNVQVSDYVASNCGAIRDEFKVTMTSEQIQQLGAAVAAGNIPGAIATAIEIGGGITERSLKDAGKLVGADGNAGIIPKPPELPHPTPPSPPKPPDLPKPPKPPFF